MSREKEGFEGKKPTSIGLELGKVDVGQNGEK
jgi:hypothetical protein